MHSALWPLVLVLSVPSLGMAERSPVPGELDQERARRFLGDVLEVGATDPKELSEAAREMLAKAQKIAESEEGLGSRSVHYVLLETGRELAERGGDLQLLVAAADRMVEHFDVDELELKLASFKSALPAISDRAELADLARRALELSVRGIRRDDYDHAQDLCDLGRAVARAIQDPNLDVLAKRRRQEVRALSREFKRAADSLETLEESPNDPKANSTVGEFYCFQKNEWEKGLPYFARGDKPRRRELARAELPGPTAPWDRIVLAESWIELAKREQRRNRESVYRHARAILRATDAAGDGLASVRLDALVQSLPGGLDLELRVTGTIDGVDELHISEAELKWLHRSHQWPRDLRLNGRSWHLDDSPTRRLPGDLRSTVLDLQRAAVVKHVGRGSLKHAVKDGVLTVTIDDHQSGASSYDLEILIPFGL